mmetsp:Transcript_17182/g.48298  ORF Transcript_17182/g.48298 Transcript_17182/m.48298 type:complete len:232 (+) Transcript_17182:219-914(+)
MIVAVVVFATITIGLSASVFVGLLEVSQVVPAIHAEFDTLFDGKGLVRCPVVLLGWLVIEHAWPEHGASTFRRDGDVQFVKVGTTSGFDVIQVDVHGEDSWTGRSVFCNLDIVVMDFVMLPNFIPQQLKVFRVVLVNAGYFRHPIDHSSRIRVRLAFSAAPSIRRRPAAVNVVTPRSVRPQIPDIGTSFVAFCASQFDEFLRLLFGHDIVHGDDPRPVVEGGRRQDLDRVL